MADLLCADSLNFSLQPAFINYLAIYNWQLFMAEMHKLHGWRAEHVGFFVEWH